MKEKWNGIGIAYIKLIKKQNQVIFFLTFQRSN